MKWRSDQCAGGECILYFNIHIWFKKKKHTNNKRIMRTPL